LTRRRFLLALALLSSPAIVAAQTARANYRIGVLSQDVAQPGLLEAFRDGLRERGYVEGKNITIEVRNGGGRHERMSALAEELIRFKPDVVVAVNTPAARAMKRATSTVPIVIMRVADPVKSGLVKSLARPGGNVTGLSFMPDELGAKGIELLRQVLPGVSRVAALFHGDNPGAVIVVDEAERAGTRLGLEFLRVPVRGAADLPAAFQSAARGRAEALFVMDDGAMTKLRTEIVGLAAEHSLPVVSIYKDFAEAGALIAYGPSLSAMYRRAADYVDRLLKGADPGRLPVEQPTEFDLIVNLRTARTLRVTIPPAVLLRANRVIE